MYESNKNNQSFRVFVGPFSVGDPAIFSAWFLTGDLGSPRVLPAVVVAGSMLASGIRNTFQRLALWTEEQRGAVFARTAVQPASVRQEAEAVPPEKRRDEAA